MSDGIGEYKGESENERVQKKKKKKTTCVGWRERRSGRVRIFCGGKRLWSRLNSKLWSRYSSRKLLLLCGFPIQKKWTVTNKEAHTLPHSPACFSIFPKCVRELLIFSQPIMYRAVLCLCALVVLTQATVPSSQRQALVDFYKYVCRHHYFRTISISLTF